MRNTLKLLTILCLAFLFNQPAFSQSNQVRVSGADALHGFSWDGTMAYYIRHSGNDYWFVKQPFDGETFGTKIYEKYMGNYTSNRKIRGLSVLNLGNGKKAVSYVLYNGSKTYLNICAPFQGDNVSFNVQNSVLMSHFDKIRGWQWDGSANAYYILHENGRNFRIKQGFYGGKEFEKYKETDKFIELTKEIRAYNNLGGKQSYMVVKDGQTYLAGKLMN
ncbi:MAG: hypothetical protein AAFY71_25650 [Bacteroidota bacterium]